MNILTMSSLALVGSLTLITGCTSGHYDHGNNGAGHAEGGHAEGGDDHHDSEIGVPGELESVDRTIAVSMDDSMRFTPAEFNVVAGETIQFDITNNGKIPHEFVLGSASAIKEHHAMMQKFPGMEHDEPNSVSLESAQQGNVIWTFSKTGTVDIACLKAGHFEAGMKGLVTVADK